jgi:ABC-type Fe3+-siderophore transport system permease subunit
VVCDSSTVTVLCIFLIFHSTNHKDTRQQGYMYIPLLILTLTTAILGTNNVLITLNDQTAIAKSVDNNWFTRT